MRSSCKLCGVSTRFRQCISYRRVLFSLLWLNLTVISVAVENSRASLRHMKGKRFPASQKNRLNSGPWSEHAIWPLQKSEHYVFLSPPLRVNQVGTISHLVKRPLLKKADPPKAKVMGGITISLMRYRISSSQNPCSWYSHYSRPCSSDKSSALWVLTQKSIASLSSVFFQILVRAQACLLWHFGLSHSFSCNYGPFSRQTCAATGLLAGPHCRTFRSTSEGTTLPLLHLPPLGCWDLQFACSDVFLLDTNKYAFKFPSWTDVNFFYKGDQENEGRIPSSPVTWCLMWGHPRFPPAQVNNSRSKRREEGLMWVPVSW